MTELTNDQKQVLDEIPGYIRTERLKEYCDFYRNRYSNAEDAWAAGYYTAILNLSIDIDNGWLNDNSGFKTE